MNQSKILSARKWFLKTALSYLGTPYIWGGDDPSGYDCSGFVLECLKTIGFINEKDDYTANGLMKFLLSLSESESDFFCVQKIDTPIESAILFSLNKSGSATHVTICLDGYFQIGASGGDSSTTDSTIASFQNAYIKIRPIPNNLQQKVLISLFNN